MQPWARLLTSLANLVNLGVGEAFDVLQESGRGVSHARHRVVPCVLELLYVGRRDAELLRGRKSPSARFRALQKLTKLPHLQLLDDIRVDSAQVLATLDIHFLVHSLCKRHGGRLGARAGGK